MKEIVINGKTLRRFDNSYYVSEDGEVYSMYSHKFLKHNIDLDGYHRVDIHSKHMKIHKLVYITWIGEIPEGKQINHKDDDKNHNHYSNLYAGSQKENIHDCINNEHRVGHKNYLTVYDKQTNETLTFCPSSDFIEYSGHPCNNGSVKRMFTRNWFKKRFDIIDYNQSKV